MFLAAAADRRRSPRHITEILDNMTELYTAAGSVVPRRRIRQPRRAQRPARHRPALPLRLRHHDAAALLERAAVGQRGRRLARPLHHPADRGRLSRGGARPRHPHRAEAAPRAAPARRRRRRPIAARQPRGTRRAGRQAAVEPMTVPMTPEASGDLRRARRGDHQRARARRGAPPTPRCWRGSARTRQKLALIAAVSRDPVAPVIRGRRRRVGDRACPALRRRRTMRAVDQHVADNEIERNHKKVLDIIRRRGTAG